MVSLAGSFLHLALYLVEEDLAHTEHRWVILLVLPYFSFQDYFRMVVPVVVVVVAAVEVVEVVEVAEEAVEAVEEAVEAVVVVVVEVAEAVEVARNGIILVGNVIQKLPNA